MEFGVWDWLGIGLIFLVLEIFVTGVFLFWVGLAATTVALLMVAMPDLGWQAQALIFAFATLVYVLSWSYFGRSKFGDKNQKESVNLNARTLDYIGQTRPLLEAITGGKGIVIIDDSRWSVSGPDLPEGALVKVVEVDGTKLVVEPVVNE